jgi:Flp pilus assembly protein TadG
MRLETVRKPRRGVHAVECALVYPITFFLILAILTGAIGIFRYQQVAFLSREAARFASTHGGQYAKENAKAIAAGTLPTTDKNYIITNIVNPKIFWMTAADITTTIQLNTPSGVYDWDNTANYPPAGNPAGNSGRQTSAAQVINGTSYSVTNTVQVSVSHNWQPMWFLSTIPLSSTSVMPMSY